MPGAIGEFMHDEGEVTDIRFDGDTISAATQRGAMRVRMDPDITCVAYRQRGHSSETSVQGVAFCLPKANASLLSNDALTGLGTDTEALGEVGELFDLGLASSHIRFCVRTNDEPLVALLKTNSERSVFDPGNPVAAALQEKSPTRVVISALGRIEIYADIPDRETPRGPHTHFLPGLLGKPETAPVPDDYCVALTLYPEHPEYDKYGEPRPFSQTAAAEFGQLLAEFGAH